MNRSRPITGITLGDPAGIGPEIILAALKDSRLYEICRPIVIGDPGVLAAVGRSLGRPPRLSTPGEPGAGVFEPGTIDVMDVKRLPGFQPAWGRPTPRTGAAMAAWIEAAADMAMEGKIAAMVTCPINKNAMRMAGQAFTGHTELLAARTRAGRHVMMMAGDRLRVALVTIHVALDKVPGLLSEFRVFDVIRVVHDALRRRFGIRDPEIAVAGLNPHAGEEGMFGDQEKTLISPAVRRARDEGMKASGPFPPDTLFYHAAQKRWDAVVCMYHDQGLIPFKLLHFEDGVNTTLGLPIIRTSVDHGTAYDIAGKGLANPRSLMAAVKMAADQARMAS
ncbi:4-hydroxythreonine-4-phosphate dehydrogenase [Candidatus Desulfarcum epimagneticum]|uniref:4-hydroxythreonine-4-phosphate dehydrogenase n=1 Tax=uncultured Desulfobacteraceae bacterium TaxID=218296 RepID=A0A484HJ69_9BACT|nr:4-hydroxythreonine-4-phosphate dehydrogenase [uncultured Desulfobacteraceae bacterium]